MEKSVSLLSGHIRILYRPYTENNLSQLDNAQLLLRKNK